MPAFDSGQCAQPRNLQSSAPAGGAPTAERLQAYIDVIKGEFDAVLVENGSVKNQRDDYERAFGPLVAFDNSPLTTCLLHLSNILPDSTCCRHSFLVSLRLW